MVQLHTFTASDYLLKNNCFDNNKLRNRMKIGKKLFHSFELRKNINYKFSGRLLIDQNDSVDALLLDEFFYNSKRVDMT